MRLLLLSLGVSFLLSGCLQDKCADTVTYQAFHPVVVTAADWRNTDFTVKSASVEVCEPSGFYAYGDYLFVVDRNEGVHIYDNHDNDKPVAVGFLPVPGGQGIAVRNDVLYLSQYLDVVTFDLSKPSTPTLLSRTEDVFEVYSVFAGTGPAGDEFVVSYVPSTETMEVSCTDLRGGADFWQEDLVFTLDASRFTNNYAPGAPDRVGQGGSLARFTISQSTLYAVDDTRLRTFSLADPTAPELVGEIELGQGIETIFPYRDQLYIGSTTGVHIYDVSNPLVPDHLSTFSHVLSCDPVVVQDDLAYVTMWGGSTCGSQDDRLLILDVSNPRQPVELQSTVMQQSHGLGVDGDRLYLCSGTDGVKVFDLDERGLLGDLIGQRSDFNAKDVIVRGDRQELIVFGWGQAGIRQYDYTRAGELSPVSELTYCQ